MSQPDVSHVSSPPVSSYASDSSVNSLCVDHISNEALLPPQTAPPTLPPTPPFDDQFRALNSQVADTVSYGSLSLDDVSSTEYIGQCSFSNVRYLIVGLVCWGCFTGSMSRGLMYTAILAMSPQAKNTTAPLTPANALVSHYSMNLKPVWASVNVTKDGGDDYELKDDTCKVEDDESHHEKETVPRGKSSPTSAGGGGIQIVPEFDWSEQKQNFIMGAYSVGFVAALVPFGRITEHYGGMVSSVIGGLLHIILDLLGPWAARQSYWALFAFRVLGGGGGAAIVPAFIYTVTHWVPDDEKSKAMAAMSVGGSLGSIFLNLVSGWLCENGFDGGWPTIFYLSGCLNFLWLLPWCWIVRSHPADHLWITQPEIRHILEHTSLSTPRTPPPLTLEDWCRMVLSGPVLALIYVKCVHAWFLSLLATKIGTYMISMFNRSLHQTAIYCTIYATFQLFSLLLCGIFSDIATRRGKCRRTNLRKSFESVATFGTALCIFAFAHTNCNHVAFLVALSLAVVCESAHIGGTGIVILDLTTDHASSLVSLVSTMTMCFGFVTPSLITFIVTEEKGHLHASWNLVFNVTGCLYLSAGLVFLLFGSAEKQNWFARSGGNVRQSVISIYNRRTSSIFGDGI